METSFFITVSYHHPYHSCLGFSPVGTRLFEDEDEGSLISKKGKLVDVRPFKDNDSDDDRSEDEDELYNVRVFKSEKEMRA